MRLSVERLRWVLIAGGVLLVAIVAGFVGYGRYRAYKTFQNILKKNGITITHETNGFTYSQSVKGKTLFTLHAAKAIQKSDGTWTLHDAELTLYSRTSPRVDHIYGSEFSYDKQADIVRAIGEVHMDLQAPEGMMHTPTPQQIRGKSGRAPSAPRSAAESTQTIHVRTSGLVYLRSLGVAATQEDVEFNYGDLVAHSHGAEFEEGQSTVHLLADVRLNGQLHGQPVALRANKADLDRDTNLATLLQPVINTQGHTITAASSLLHLRKAGSIEAIDASGGVTMVSGTQTIHSQLLNVQLNENMVAQRATLTGGVTLVDTSLVKPMHGSAQAVDTTFTADGQPSLITATGNAMLAMTSYGGPTNVKLNRGISGDKIIVAMVPSRVGGKTRVGTVHSLGHAHADGESLVLAANGKGGGGRKTTALAADDLLATFAEGERNALLAQHLTGHGHTRLQQNEPTGATQTSTGDTLELAFAPPPAGSGEMRVTTATETGHVNIRTQAAAKAGKPGMISTADSEQALYDGTAETLTLTGSAKLHQPGTEVSAKTVVLNQSTGDAEATGDVLASLANKDAKSKREASHVLSERATFSNSAQIATFFGTDAHPAKLWQDGSQILAATLTLNGATRNLIARPAAAKGSVSAIFVSTPTASTTTPDQKKTANTPHVLRVVSPAMDYSDKSGEAVFSGGVSVHTATGDMRSQRAVVFLRKTATPSTPAPSASAATPSTGQIDRAVLSGDVHLVQPGRSGTGDQLLYTAATDSFVLTGTPTKQPHIVDSQQGNLTGSTLLFGAADSTIIVSGTPGPKSSTGRVRTETTIAPK